MKPGFERAAFFILTLLSAFLVAFFAFNGQTTFDTGDGVQHYLIARYSWAHPHLLLDSWGKPFFTLVSSPFAQFGLKGMIIFQTVCSIGTCLILFRLGQKFRFNHLWAIPLLLFFSPIYFPVINSGLTEIFFGFMLMLAVLLAVEKRFIAAGLITSLLPFVRSEGYMILVLFALLFLVRKQFRAIPVLLTGVLAYTLIGYFHFEDWLWVISTNQKLGNEGYEGMKGSFFHFIVHYKDIWGTAFALATLTGIILVIILGVKRIRNFAKEELLPEEFILVLGSFTGGLLIHSLMYSMPGVLNNLGMLRYMTLLIPASVFLALHGLQLFDKIPKGRFAFFPTLFTCIIAGLVVTAPFSMWYFPYTASNEQLVINAAATWIKSQPGEHKKIYYMHPYVPPALACDPFDFEQCNFLSSVKGYSLQILPERSWLIWDSHYSPVEGGMSLEKLKTDTNVILAKHFRYYQNSYPFETLVFKKKTSSIRSMSTSIDLITDFGPISEFQCVDSAFFDFDVNLSPDSAMLSHEQAFSGSGSLKHTPDIEYGFAWYRKRENIPGFAKWVMAEVDLKIFPVEKLNQVILVMEIRDEKNEVVSWNGHSLPDSLATNTWSPFQARQVFFKTDIERGHLLKIYLWNNGKKLFYIDDVHLHYYRAGHD